MWAPHLEKVSIHALGENERVLDMERSDRGYHLASVDGMDEDTRYFYRLDDASELPDPASRFQPEGVHGPSQLVDTALFEWADKSWKGIDLEDSIFYELHVGTYTAEGTFEAIIEHLDELRDLGVTTVELMPVAQFPGSRNWGYDGVFPFAPQNSYGGPHGLQRLVNAAHGRGLAVALDVVYNHLGPEGNYLSAYAPYFTNRYRTPWGEAVNYDGERSDEVRRYFRENALYWLEQYHIDALRLDAIHGIFDFSAAPFLAELRTSVAELGKKLGRKIHLIAESDLNDSRVLAPKERGGYEMDAQWSDDFHHSVHTLLTREKTGYYEDFGELSHLTETLRKGWCYGGQYSRFRKRRHGNCPEGFARSRFVVCNQNHDQVGNRAAGERLSALVDFESLKLAAGITLLSPFVPLLFMGEEYAENVPFQYFISHLDKNLVEAVRRGRKDEFAAFGWAERVPDPQDEATFQRSKLQHQLKKREPHIVMWRFYKELIRKRREWELGRKNKWHVWERQNEVLALFREEAARHLLMVFNFSDEMREQELQQRPSVWRTRVWSADRIWNGPAEPLPVEVRMTKPFVLNLHPHSFAVFESQLSDLERA